MSTRHPAFHNYYPRPSHGPNPHEFTAEERAHVLDRLQAGGHPKSGLVRKLVRLYDQQKAQLDEAEKLWTEWSTTDITADEDRWIGFSDRVHAWLKAVRR